ncbi:serine hydroxymethyltransferase [Patescibacteria group bacterium]
MSDQQIISLIKKEIRRQQDTLMLIPSENYVSLEVRKTLGSVLTNKYSEGYPGKRYYQGNALIDQVEALAQERAQKIFSVPHANVQAYSGSIANLAILNLFLEPQDVLLSQSLEMGGHLSMGQSASATSRYYQAQHYRLTEKGEIDWSDLEEKVKKYSPKLIFCGGTAYTKVLDFARFAQIADQAKAFLVADISHVAGLVVGGVHPSPVKHVHLVMTTTHKTLRGPRGAIIMATQKGLQKDPKIAEKIDRSVFPGLQGGPHNNNIAAIAVSLFEAQAPLFKEYAHQVVINAKFLAQSLVKHGYDLVGQGTQNHMIWLDLSESKVEAWVAALALEVAGMIVNRQMVPFDRQTAYYPSGIRLGTPAVTTRGMREKEMKLVADLFHQTISVASESFSSDDLKSKKEIKGKIMLNKKLLNLKDQVAKLCHSFPIE